MPDEIIQELWTIKDSMAREHGSDVRRLAAYLQGRKEPEQSSEATGRPAVNISNLSPDQQLLDAGEGNTKDGLGRALNRTVKRRPPSQ